MIKNLNETIWDVVIIGAGIAGLTASIHLPQTGRSVLVVDKGAQPGGRGMTNQLAGAQVNLGAHALSKSALPLLHEVGVTPVGTEPKPPGKLIVKDADGEFIPISLTQLLLGPFLKWKEKTQLLRFYSRLRKADTPALSSITLQAYLESRISSLRVRHIVLALVRLSTYCDAPELLSAGAAIEQLRQGGVIYVDRGWQSIVNQLIERAQRLGTSFLNHSQVLEVSGSTPNMTVTLKNGTQLAARNVISTAGPSEMLAFLNPALSTAEAAIYQNLIPVRAACLDLVVSGMPQQDTKFVLGIEAPWYYSNHSQAALLTDGRAHEVIHVMKYLPASGRSDAKEDKRELENFLDIIQPGWRRYVIQERFLPRMLVSHGTVTAVNGGLAGRPGPAVKGRPGLFIAGDWVGSKGMLLNASLASAKEAAQCIVSGIDQDKEGIHGGT
ncbi:FAD-dependent oxidoreductase [Paenibacillus sp. JX-17]|uniref:FAD-dependent oxidoreductase n=1 Tax=Paenibacillus lacisoli TaxID=3064525 RepID=A0ABT9CEN5_9BACL|nr:FAD-dependent oxidoreductase [Paenibacillus sp. JX-17]MDO7907742.1 FAD-dependent oxidoreductase [Paenibacillus sp. JX-17]